MSIDNSVYFASSDLSVGSALKKPHASSKLQDKIKNVAQDFEAHLISNFLGLMKKESNASVAENIFQGFLINEFGKTIATQTNITKSYIEKQISKYIA